MIETKTVGKTLAHDSAALHVQGSATYVDDMREPEGLVHVYPGFAKDGALGAITRLDLDAVRAAPGVIAVLTAKDIPGVNDCAPVVRRRSDPRRRQDHVPRPGDLRGGGRNARGRAPRRTARHDRDRGGNRPP